MNQNNSKSSESIEKMVLGTAQFGMDYGIANVVGKPSKKEVFGMLDLAWGKGIRRFDTAPGYGSETLLGEFIAANGIRDEAIVLTKIPSLGNSNDYKQCIKKSLELSLKNLGCTIDILFFHDPADSQLLLECPDFFEKLMHENLDLTLGVSVYEPEEIEKLLGCGFELAYQFPFNVLDRRFEKVKMPVGKRNARSIFLQGLLAFANGLRAGAPPELIQLQNDYHSLVNKHRLNPVDVAVTFVNDSEYVDYFLVGVDTGNQLRDILKAFCKPPPSFTFIEPLLATVQKKLITPTQWN